MRRKQVDEVLAQMRTYFRRHCHARQRRAVATLVGVGCVDTHMCIHSSFALQIGAHGARRIAGRVSVFGLRVQWAL